KDGAEALDFIFAAGAFANRKVEHLPKVILLDLKLPKVDGIEVLRRIKSDDRTKHTPVVMLTSSQEERDVLNTYNLGVNSYIVKPVDFSHFVHAVSELGVYWGILNKVTECVAPRGKQRQEHHSRNSSDDAEQEK